ncbi:MAG: 6-phosphofructokinase [Gammaproteobacteria bacterium]|nr:6-phosphofructokinase [Gammaproteobacteria bacterium]
MKKNAFYAQSGGVTAVINTTAAAVIETARAYPDKIGTVFAGHNGIAGALKEELIDTSVETDADIAALKYTPGGAFGSCRYKLKDYKTHPAEYERLVQVFAAHDIGYFFYNGGNDSQDTTNKISQYCQQVGYPLQCIGVPKTIDNDLAVTDNCPGFGSVAKFIATTIREAAFDVKSMCATSTKVFVMEVMGRHAGWIAAAGGLAAEKYGDAPHIILFPEIAFDPERFYRKVHDTVAEIGFCVIIVSEGVKNEAGRFLADAGIDDAFGHRQLGGVAPVIVDLLSRLHGYKCHWAVPDYLQRSAAHLVSQTDWEQAYAIGKSAVEMAIAGKSGIMCTIVRDGNMPYRWSIGATDLNNVANQEKKLPPEFISADGFGITQAARDYLSPLIQGEHYPIYKNGLPNYITLENKLVAKKLPTDPAKKETLY